MKQDPISSKLQAAQKPLTRHLWTPEFPTTFTPQVLTKVYGDGRALFGIGTINSRPAYWIIRGCSSWQCGLDVGNVPDDAPEIVEFIDDITFDIEEEFGRADSEYTYQWTANYRLRCRETGRFLSERDISYPVFNYGGGAHWFRLSWPELDGVRLVPHPFSRHDTILAETKRVRRPKRSIAPPAPASCREVG